MADMPRPSGKEMVQFLERRGFAVLRIRGSHHFMEQGDHRTTVPVHGNTTLKLGTLRSILRDIDMSVEEFKEAWNG